MTEYKYPTPKKRVQLPERLPIFSELLTPEQQYELRVRRGFERFQEWLFTLPQDVRGTVALERGKIVVECGRFNAAKGSPYYPNRQRCIHYIKEALAGRPHQRRDDEHARWEVGRKAVSSGKFDALGEAVFGHLRHVR